jgi:hypothetical protein
MSHLSNPRNLQRSNLGALTDERARCLPAIAVGVSSAEDKLILTPLAVPAPGR